MKLLFITPGISKRGGCVILTGLVRELKKRGYDIELVAFNREKDQKYLSSWFLWKDLNPKVIKIEKKNSKESQAKEFSFAVRKYITENENKFDRIIIDSWHTFTTVAKEGMIDKRFFQLVQSDPIFKSVNIKDFWEETLFSILPKIKIQRIVVSKILKKIFKQREKQETQWMRLFIREKFFKVKYKVRESKMITLVSSSADFNIPSKGLNFLLEVLNEFSKKHQFKLILISGNRIKKKNLKKLNFKFKEETAESAGKMIELLEKGDIYLNSSSKESFCLALAEAMAIGMPCVALDSVGNREYANDKNMKLVKNKEEFLRGLNELLRTREREKIGEEARKTMKKYQLSKTADDFERIIKR